MLQYIIARIFHKKEQDCELKRLELEPFQYEEEQDEGGFEVHHFPHK
jgi:hypothetical protein